MTDDVKKPHGVHTVGEPLHKEAFMAQAANVAAAAQVLAKRAIQANTFKAHTDAAGAYLQAAKLWYAVGNKRLAMEYSRSSQAHTVAANRAPHRLTK